MRPNCGASWQSKAALSRPIRAVAATSRSSVEIGNRNCQRMAVERNWAPGLLTRSSETSGSSKESTVNYPITLTPDDNGTLLVSCPDLPEVVTFGEDREEALQRA